MNINQYTGFIRWMAQSFAKSVAKKNREFRDLMDNEFWLSFILWVLLTALAMVPVGFIAAYYLDPASGDIRTVMKVYLGTAIAYFVGTGVSIMYGNYRQEQEEIIRELARRG